jgi:hypothetical protein
MSARIRGALVWVVAVSLSCPAIATAATGPLTASQASAQARQTGTAVVVSSLATNHSTTTANPNGTFTTADSLTGGAPDAWTEIDSAKPLRSGWDQTQPEQVGRGHDGVARSFYQFDATQLAGVTVLGSQLTVTEVDSAACTVPARHDGTVNLYLTGTIDQHTNWVNQPRRTSGVIASSNAQHGHDSTCPSATVTFDVTSAIQSRTAGNTATFGLRADDELDKYGWKEFDNAVWFTTYDITPVAPSNPRMSPGQCATTTPYPLNPETEMDLRVDTSVRSDGVETPLTVAFTVLDATGATVLGNSFQTGAGGTAQLDIAAGELPDGTYTWTATASDGTLTSGPSPTCGFQIDTKPPANPVITVNGPAGCTTQSCTVPVRTPINVTFSDTGTGEIPASYVYQLGFASPVTVAATNGTWTGNIEPRDVGFTTLTVRSLTAAGTNGATASMTIITTAVPSVDGDFNGDGHPDLLSVGNIDGLAPGVWLSPGDGTGHLGTPSDIGINGTGISTTSSPSDWNGAIIAHGQFFGTGEQDILAVLPPSPDIAQNAFVMPGSGDGSPLTASPVSVSFTTDGFNPLTSAQTITQITAVGNLPEDSCAPNCASAGPDLFAVVNNQLWWFQTGFVIGDFQGGVVLDSTIDWSTKQISGTTYAGQPALVVRDKNTGEIDLYANGQGANWFTSATKIVMTTTSAAADQIDAIDANSDDQPDLWTVATDGEVTFYPGIGNGQLGTPTSAGTL